MTHILMTWGKKGGRKKKSAKHHYLSDTELSSLEFSRAFWCHKSFSTSHKALFKILNTIKKTSSTWVCAPRWSGAAGRCSGSWGACETATESCEGSPEENHKGTSWGIRRASWMETVVSAWRDESCWVGRKQPPRSFPTQPRSSCRARGGSINLPSYAGASHSRQVVPINHLKAAAFFERIKKDSTVHFILWGACDLLQPGCSGIFITFFFSKKLSALPVDGHKHECRSEPSPQQQAVFTLR